MSISIERRPQLLKDYLDADLNSSCSSNGFRSFPRKPCETTVRNLIDLDLNLNKRTTANSQFKLRRSRSSKAASNTISAIHKASEIVLINAVKLFQSVKSPSALPKSISRRLSKGNEHRVEQAAEMEKVTVTVTVKVKDILRWRSFRDLIEEKPPPLDLSSSPNQCTTTTESTSSNSSSSWCESDFTFTSENLPLWCGKNEFNREDDFKMGKKKCLLEDGVGGYQLKATTGVEEVDPMEDLLCKEKEQQSPVSVLDFPLAEDEEPLSSLHQSPAYMQRRISECMLQQKNQEFERLAELQPVNLEKEFREEEKYEYEEKAKRLLSHVKATSSTKGCEPNIDCVLLDFFRHELESTNQTCYEFDREIVRVAKAWIHGEFNGSFEWEVDEKRYNYIRDMERGVMWSKFGEEQEELASEIEVAILNYLVYETLVDL